MTDLATRLEQATEETCYDAIADFVNGYCDERVMVTFMDFVGEAERLRCPALLLGVVAACVPEGWCYQHSMYTSGKGWGCVYWPVEGKNERRHAETSAPIPACALAAAIVRATATTATAAPTTSSLATATGPATPPVRSGPGGT